MKHAIVLVFLMSAPSAHAQPIPTLGPGSNIEKAPELNRDALNAVPKDDISARIRVMQGAINNSSAWMRRQRAQQKPQPNIEIPSINPQEH